jgi:hypothetical protein
MLRGLGEVSFRGFLFTRPAGCFGVPSVRRSLQPFKLPHRRQYKGDHAMVRAISLASLLLFCVFLVMPASAEVKSSATKKQQVTTRAMNDKTLQTSSGDLRPVLEKMRSQKKLIQGKNLVAETKAQGSTPAIKFMAIVNKGRITKWDAVDGNGKSVQTAVYRAVAEDGGITVECQVCAIVKQPDNSTTKVCYNIDCKDAPKPSLSRM